MTIYEANQYQPDICVSLSSEWLTRMMASPAEGENWSRRANAAAQDSDFYNQHRAEQAELTSTPLINRIKQQQLAIQLPAVQEALGAELHQFLYARAPVLDSLRDKTTDKIMLLRIRGLRVSRSQTPATLDTLKTEFLRLSGTPRYYLISVKAHEPRSHAIAVVSTKCEGFFTPGGYLYYYDPNLRRVVRWDSRNELNGFLDRTLLGDYASINSIWQVEQA